MPGTPIGLKDVYYAKLLSDTSTGVTYDTPVEVIGAITANINPNGNMATLFADDAPFDTAATLGEIELELNLADIPAEVQADWLGHTVSSGKLIRRSSDVPNWVALGFKSLKSNGYYRYVWLTKGKFMLPEQQYQTKGDSIEFKAPTIVGRFVARAYDDEWIRSIDEDHEDYVASVGTNWFTAVDGTTLDITPPTVTVVPADTTSGVAVSANIVWTFSEAMRFSSLNSKNFLVFKDDGTAVAGTLSVSTATYDNDTVTFNPTGNLASASNYVAVCTTNVCDLAGNHLEEASITNFTTT